MISIAIVSNREILFDAFLSEVSVNELKHFRSQEKLIISVCMQEPLTISHTTRAENILRGAGINFTYCFRKSESPPKMAALRQASFQQAASAEFIVMLDDDMELRPGSAAAYLRAINYLRSSPECGAVLCGGFFGSHYFGDRIVPYRGKMPGTDQGIVLRNDVNGNLFHEDCLPLVGGAEEVSLLVSINLRNLFVAKQFRNPTANKNRLPTNIIGATNSQLHSIQIVEKNQNLWACNALGLPIGFGKRMVNLKFKFPVDKEVSAIFKSKNKKRFNRTDFKRFTFILDGLEYFSFKEATKLILFKGPKLRAIRAQLQIVNSLTFENLGRQHTITKGRAIDPFIEVCEKPWAGLNSKSERCKVFLAIKNFATPRVSTDFISSHLGFDSRPFLGKLIFTGHIALFSDKEGGTPLSHAEEKNLKEAYRKMRQHQKDKIK